MINVLSLFDGMSCGQIALARAGVVVGVYYASEIDKHAITVTQANCPNTIQLGDIVNWRGWDIDWGSIDLVIGGSPCQGFSFAGKQLAIGDPRSALFFAFVDILNHIKKANQNVRFLLENVKMKKAYLDVISECLGVEPMFINSALVSAQNRQRYYWSNLDIEQPEDVGVHVKDILEDGAAVAAINGRYLVDGVRQDGKMKTAGLTSQYVEFRHDGKSNALTTVCKDNVVVPYTMRERILATDITYRNLTPLECERLQTVPDNYTAHVSKTQRYKMLGNGFTVDVIAHILRGLRRRKNS